MEVRRDELDDSSYQLMLDIQTGRSLERPKPRRGRKLLAVTLVVLGGFVGLLVAGGRLTSEPTSPRRAITSASSPPAWHLPPNVTPEPTGFLPPREALEQKPLAVDIQPTPPRKTDSTAKSLAATPSAQSHVKSAAKRPRRDSNATRTVKRTQKEPPQTVYQYPSRPLWTRSPLHDFDPNAELVRSSP
jgi:hypothetical protein